MTEKMNLGKNPGNKQYHIALEPGQTGGYAILPGDPGRVSEIAAKLENPVFIAENREFRTYTGSLGGERLCVMSTGMGGPSAAIAIEELIKCGVHTFIRVGTCGGMHSRVLPGDIVIAQAAIRAEGTSGEYLPNGYPACADFTVTDALRRSAADAGLRYHIGVVHCKDSFYGQTEPDSMPLASSLNERWQSYLRCGCLASEMEAAALYAVGLARGVRVGAVLTAIWNPELQKRGLPQSEFHDNSRAIACAVGALRLIIAEDSKP